MLINEVCSIVGLSRKTIRYYEEEGILNPTRNKNNDYRIYNDNDIRLLKIIKFLRELNVSIADIKKLEQKEITLEECMSDRIVKIEAERKNFSKIKNMCNDIIESGDSFESIEITKYSEEMNILNKRGFTMRDVKSNNKKKILGAITSSIIFSLFFLFIVVIISYFQFTEAEKIPWFFYIFIVGLFLVPVFGIYSNLFIRIKEIKGGEEDEASKY